MNHDTPMRHVFHKIGQFLYEPSLAIDVLGTYETMNSINKEKIILNLRKFILRII